VNEKLTLGMRYTNVEYQVSGSSFKAKSNGLGAAVGYRF
jgi:hypothetical protein